MIRSRKLAYLEEQLSRQKDKNKELTDELKALEVEFHSAKKAAEDKARENELLKENTARLMERCEERMRAAEEAKKSFEDAAKEIRELQRRLRTEAEEQLQAMRGENKNLK